MNDPPVRRDGRCTVCRKPRKPERSRKYGKAVAELDPFCSNTCARTFHGQPDLDEQGRQGKAAAESGMRTAGLGQKAIQHGTVEGYRLCACDQCKAAVTAARTQA